MTEENTCNPLQPCYFIGCESCGWTRAKEEAELRAELDAQNEAYLDQLLSEDFNPFEPQLSEAEQIRQIQESWDEDPEDF